MADYDKLAQQFGGSANAEAKTAPDKYDQIANGITGTKSAATEPAQKSFIEQASQGIGDTVAGAVRGAGSIGATLLTPIDAAARALGVQNGWIGRTDRREAMDAGLKDMGANPDALLYKGGKLATEIAGTAGAGGVLAKGAESIPALTRALPALPMALRTGGFRLGTPAAAGKVGGALTRVGAGAAVGGVTAGAINPDEAATGAIIGGALPGGIKAASLVGRGIKDTAGVIAKNTLGTMTGVGAEAISAARQAGKTGNDTFLKNMRGEVPLTDVLDNAKSALEKMRADRSMAYRNGMTNISNDKTVLDFQPINDAFSKVKDIGSFKGQSLDKSTTEVKAALEDQLQNWSGLNPAEYHAPEGFDALKRSIGDIRDSTPFGTPARKVADSVYNSVKDQIVSQAPAYAKVMAGYSSASNTLDEITKALSLGNKASADTGMRKLQSLMRNNVQTNYGNRLDLANTLAQQGGADILPAVAGQGMNSWMPRGLVGQGEKLGMIAAPFVHPAGLLAAPFTSPRLVGESLYKLGQGQAAAASAANTVKQLLPNAGKMSMEQQNAVQSLLRGMAVNPSLRTSR